ncbi:hypothetical protein DFJ77DRAFT_132528 [Powellomyces hirtus]|nr:hypothetical protein DFJ77DRAFT_132528 [Powellomyces hirtus]
MFVPALQQSNYATKAAQTIRGLSNRTFHMAIATALAVEVAAKDVSAWLPGFEKLWLSHYVTEYDNAELELMTNTETCPSLLAFPSVQHILKVGGTCYLRDHGGCDPAVRTYNASIGFTQELVTGPYQSLAYTWHENILQFMASAETDQTFFSPNLFVARAISDDLADGAKTVNDLLVADITLKNNQAKAFTLLAFSISVAVFLSSYLVVHRRLIGKFKQQLDGCIWLVFSLPPEITAVLPDLKRFVESGGALLPGHNKH